MNEENLSAFIEALNLSDDHRAILSSEEVNADASKELASNYLQSIRENAKELLSNDSDFRKQFYDNGYKEAEGKFRGSYRNAFKSEFGLTLEEIEGKNERELIQLAKAKFSTGSDDVKAWQEKLVKLQNQYEEDKTNWQQQVETVKNESKSFVERFKAEQQLSAFMPENLAVTKDVALLALKDRLSKRGLRFGDSESGFEITKADGSYLTSGNEVLKDPQAVVAMLVNDLLRQSNASPENTGNGKQPIVGKVDSKNVNPRLQKAMENAKRMGEGYNF